MITKIDTHGPLNSKRMPVSMAVHMQIDVGISSFSLSNSALLVILFSQGHKPRLYFVLDYCVFIRLEISLYRSPIITLKRNIVKVKIRKNQKLKQSEPYSNPQNQNGK